MSPSAVLILLNKVACCIIDFVPAESYRACCWRCLDACKVGRSCCGAYILVLTVYGCISACVISPDSVLVLRRRIKTCCGISCCCVYCKLSYMSPCTVLVLLNEVTCCAVVLIPADSYRVCGWWCLNARNISGICCTADCDILAVCRSRVFGHISSYSVLISCRRSKTCCDISVSCVSRKLSDMLPFAVLVLLNKVACCAVNFIPAQRQWRWAYRSYRKTVYCR